MKNAFIIFCLLLGLLQLESCTTPETGPAIGVVEENERLPGGPNFTTYDLSENAFGEMGSALVLQQQDKFVTGNSFFRSNWVTAPSSVKTLDGLGPMMNAISCGSCHFKDGRARPPNTPEEALNGLLFRLSIPGTNLNGEPLDDPNYGGQLQDKAILGVDHEAKVRVTYQEIAATYPDGTAYRLRKPYYEFYDLKFGAFSSDMMFSPRIAMQIPGLGLLENIAESEILSRADENDKDDDGISGKANYVWDAEHQQTRLGRFGWKANQATIKMQTASAFNGDIGITTSLFPTESLTEQQKLLYANVPNGGAPEMDDETLEKIVSYVQTLSVPVRRNVDDKTILRGKFLFAQTNCSACHTPVMQTGNTNDIASLNKQIIRPYTDLLLHDMGEDLADGRPDFLADGNEWRTPPLWGIGLIRTVNNHSFLLHDGRARNTEEAILWHGGEGSKSKAAFLNLSKDDRAALLKFVESL